MDDEKKIAELQKQLDTLSEQVHEYREAIVLLRQELSDIQKKIHPANQPATLERRGQNFSIENFIGLRIIHLVGIVVVVVGLSIGVKYALDRQLISEGARIMLAYAAGVILFFLSRRLKRKYLLFSAILFSGAMASLYFTTYAAFVYYGFFSFSLSFILMAGLTVFTAFESIQYNRQEIAILGLVGAYAIPFLISSNADRADLFFSYILFINAGIVYLSFKKKWRLMSQLALLVSWALFILWGLFRYDVKDFSTGVIILGIFYVLFVVNALAYRIIGKQTLNGGQIQQVIINNIALYFSALIIFGNGHFGTHLAEITGFVCLLIGLLAWFSYLFFPLEILLQQSMAMQAVVLAAMFVGFYWNGFLVTVFWIVMAIVLFVWGLLKHRSWPRLTAILLMTVTLGKLVIFDSSKFSTLQKIIAYMVIGTLLLVVSFFYQKFRQTSTRGEGPVK